MNNLGFGFNLLDQHKRSFLIAGNPFSVSCQLSDLDGKTQGNLIKSGEQLRGLVDEVGLSISADTGLGVLNDTVEFVLDINDVKIGKPSKGWRLCFPNRQGTIQNFKVEENIIDKTIGVYRLKLSIIVSADRANRVRTR